MTLRFSKTQNTIPGAQRVERSIATLGHVVLIGIDTCQAFIMTSNRDMCAYTVLRISG